MILLRNEESKSHRNQKVCYKCKEEFSLMMAIKNTIKYEITVITVDNIEVLLTMFVI